MAGKQGFGCNHTSMEKEVGGGFSFRVFKCAVSRQKTQAPLTGAKAEKKGAIGTRVDAVTLVFVPAWSPAAMADSPASFVTAEPYNYGNVGGSPHVATSPAPPLPFHPACRRANFKLRYQV
jgi:hypothetical protein